MINFPERLERDEWDIPVTVRQQALNIRALNFAIS